VSNLVGEFLERLTSAAGDINSAPSVVDND